MITVDLNRYQPPAGETDIAESVIDDQYTYHAWDMKQIARGNVVRDVLKAAALAIVMNVPASADRSTALRKLREARMDADSAITHGGKY